MHASPPPSARPAPFALALLLAAPLATAPATPAGAPRASARTPPAEEDAAAQELVGPWTGWLYMDDGDAPVRARVEPAEEGWVALVDLPAAGQSDVGFAARRTADGGLVLAYPSEEEARARLDLDPGASEGVLVGAVDWFGVAGEAWLHRAARAVVRVEPETAAELVGLWGEPPGVAVRQRAWGELVLTDARTGAERTLFAPAGADEPGERWFTGPALYVAAPVERELEVARSETGEAVALIERSGGAERRLGRRGVERLDVVVEREGARLAGTLTLPDDPRPACAVIAGGSDWTTREGLDRFTTLLAANGFASIAYDKRGHGDSEGERDVAFATTAQDLVAFAELARAHPSLPGGEDGARVGYLGISRGGWYGALAASSDPAAAFFVDLVGPAVSPAAQETTARLDRLREAGADAEELALGERYLDALWGFARGSVEGERYLELRRKVEEAGWLGELEGAPSLAEEPWRWARLNADFDPAPALRSLRCPTLVLYGEEDLAVAARVNAPRMREALAASGAEPARVVVLSGADHDLRTVERDAEGRRLPFHAQSGPHPDAWPTILAFLRGIGA